MAGKPTDDPIANYREENTPEEEPLRTITQKLGKTGGGDSPSTTVVIAAEACDIIGFPRGDEAVGTEVEIDIYRDRYVVRPKP